VVVHCFFGVSALIIRLVMPTRGNKYGRKGIQAPWDAIKALWCSGGKTTKEIAATFGVHPNTIETRASRERWSELRSRVLKQKKSHESRGGPARVSNPYAADANPPITEVNVSEIDPRKNTTQYAFTQSKDTTNEKKNVSDAVIVERALAIADSTKFRERVIAANDKALTVLEKQPPTNVGEVDRFAEALTKVERIGARTYGYDRETDRPVINIGVLTQGAEYE
jgi:hypothetical protein